MITNAEIINLFKFVNDGNLLELQKILKNNTDNKSKKKLDKVKDRSGRTLIHAAIDRNNKQIIDAFLAIDVSLKEVNADGKTVLTVAEERGLEQLAALLRTRLEWQETIKTFRINQIMHLLMEGFPDIKRANGRNKVLFIASTGAGKSTLVNYLNGTRYKILKNAMGVEAIPSGGVPEIAKVGRSSY
jgi:ankyrin repeat protein